MWLAIQDRLFWDKKIRIESMSTAEALEILGP